MHQTYCKNKIIKSKILPFIAPLDAMSVAGAEGHPLAFLLLRMFEHSTKMAAPMGHESGSFPLGSAKTSTKPCRACTDFKTWMQMQGKSVQVCDFVDLVFVRFVVGLQVNRAGSPEHDAR